MSNLALAVADAVVTALTGGTYSQAFTARRDYEPAAELEDADVLDVVCVPRAWAEEPETRSSTRHDLQVAVGVRKKLGQLNAAAEKTALDGLMTLVAEIAARLRRRQLTVGTATAAWLRSANEPIMSPEHLRSWRQFTSVLTVTYRMVQ